MITLVLILWHSIENLSLFLTVVLARPWLKDDLDAWIERLKVGLSFN